MKYINTKFTKIKRSAIGKTFALCFLVLLLFVMLCACNRQKDEPMPIPSICYDIVASYEESSDTLIATQEILYTAPQDQTLDRIVLHVFPNAFEDENGKIEFLSVEMNKSTVDHEIYGKDNTLMSIPCAMDKGQTCTITLVYTVTVPHTDARLGITSEGTINLTCFYPVIAKYDNGWREDVYSSIGDPFYTDISSFYVTFNCADNFLIASSGKITDETLSDGRKTVEIEAENIRDFGMAIGQFNTQTLSAEVGKKEVNINYFYIDDASPEISIDRTAQSIQTFSSVFGAYPYDTFTVVQSGLDAGGMEYGSFVIIAPSENYDQYLDTITHETAHQWWYNTVGNDQFNQAWLDEGLTEFCTSYFHYLNGDRQAHTSVMARADETYRSFESIAKPTGFDGKMNKHLSEFLTQGEYVAVTYLKGALMFETIRSLVGDTKFTAALATYYNNNKFAIATDKQLVSAFKTQGYDISSIVEYYTL